MHTHRFSERSVPGVAGVDGGSMASLFVASPGPSISQAKRSESGRLKVLHLSSGNLYGGVETIEHLENPRAFVRELTRLARPGGWVVVTTPNQLSLLSKLTLGLKNEFNAFQSGSYPAHLTALLEADLRRIAAECGWSNAMVVYTCSGRIPGTARHWPRWLSCLFPCVLSDNLLIIGRRPGDGLRPAIDGADDL